VQRRYCCLLCYADGYAYGDDDDHGDNQYGYTGCVDGDVDDGDVGVYDDDDIVGDNDGYYGDAGDVDDEYGGCCGDANECEYGYGDATDDTCYDDYDEHDEYG